MYAVVTNSTYDGLCYNARRVEELLDPSVDRIHFDEAWYAYARFNPIYRDRHAMHGDPKDHKGPTTFATHSTHKLLAALSQASLLHIRDGRSPIPHERFNESFMMHASTSPLYPIIVSNDITAAMMDGPGGAGPHQRVDRGSGGLPPDHGPRAPPVREQEGLVLQHLERGQGQAGQARQRRSAFEDAQPEFLATEPDSWVLHPGETWHGFGDIEDGYCMLDPIKVSIVTPGVADKGGLDKRGIPATLVTAYLHRRGVEVEKTTDFTILFLFSIGITKGKWGTLLNVAARLQARLRPQRAAGRGPALPGRGPSRHLREPGAARPGRPDVRPAQGVAADALAGGGVLDAPHAGHDAERGVPAPRPRRDRARVRSTTSPTGCSPPASFPTRRASPCSCPASRRAPRTAPTSVTCARWRPGTGASPASATTRTASRTATAPTTCSA